jgi:uncharacterized membrane protein YfcA
MLQRTSSWTSSLDRVGVYASVVCFVHCLAMPVLLSLLSVYAHLLPTEEHIHRPLAMVVTVLGALAIASGYRRHRRRSVWMLMGAGLSFIFAGAFFGDRLPSHWMEVLVTLAGSCCMIAAHRKNHTFCGECDRCSQAE